MTAAAAARPVPTATYRLQVRQGFGFADVADLADYLTQLGVSHAYLSPVLQAAPGSQHGYDVVDHTRISTDAGGLEGLRAMSAALRGAGLRLVVDVVPNHMALPTPEHLNRPLWSVLREGPASPYATWFDVDWSAPDEAVLMPVLGHRIGEVLDAGELRLDDHGGAGQDEPVLHYYAHEFPVRPGTEQLPLRELVDRQCYRLAHWRVAVDEVNYRRFFEVDTLVAVRVERPEVFEETHRLLLDLVADGSVDGLRVDHPDGLADPEGYLDRLADATGGAWVVVEKILEGDEQLPAGWACAGTTGYDALHRLGGVFVDPDGAAGLSALLAEVTGHDIALPDVREDAKRAVATDLLAADVLRLVGLLAEVCHHQLSTRDHTRRALHAALVELLVQLPRYRAYVRPGEPAPVESVQVVTAAADRAAGRLAEQDVPTLTVVRDLVLGRAPQDAVPGGRWTQPAAQVVIRFQQICGPVMAKGVEDTAFYRWHRLVSLNEVGGDPDTFGVSVNDLHDYLAARLRCWPDTMTTLSTHDTKRSEDVRARLSTLAERPQEWAALVRELRTLTAGQRPARLDPATEYLLWQTLVGTWDPATGPIAADRLHGFLLKAVREANEHTSWTGPDVEYEAAVESFADAALDDPLVVGMLTQWAHETQPAFRVVVLGQKLLQLIAPGVPDVYQGTELVDLSLVDPDNRRPVDFTARRARLGRLDAGGPPQDLDDEKLLVTSRALRLRRNRPSWFTGRGATFRPLDARSGHLVGFVRGDEQGPGVVALATRLPVALAAAGGWTNQSVALPAGRWLDQLTGRRVDAGSTGARLSAGGLLADLPVALLVRAS